MTDKDNASNRPDNASAADFDDLDVPTYQRSDSPATGSSATARPAGARSSASREAHETEVFSTPSESDAADSAQPSSLFGRSGKASPQAIDPNSSAPTTAFPSGQSAGSQSAGSQSASSQPEETRYDGLADRESEPRYQERAPERTYEEPRYEQPAQQHAASSTASPAPADDAPVAESAEECDERLRREQDEAARAEGYRTFGRRGTIDFGLLFVRLALSAYLLLAGAKGFFDLGGSGGLEGLKAAYDSYAMAEPLAIAVPTMQLLAGAFLLFGLLTPIAAMIGLVATGFTALDALTTSGAGLDITSWPDNVWLHMVLFVVAFALQFTGPGFISLDFGRSWTRRPLASSWIFVILGLAALAALWWFGAAVNPIS